MRVDLTSNRQSLITKIRVETPDGVMFQSKIKHLYDEMIDDFAVATHSYDIQPADFFGFEFPAGLPLGYMIVVAYKRYAKVLRVVACWLYGPTGFIDRFDSLNDAVNYAIQLETAKAIDECGSSTPKP